MGGWPVWVAEWLEIVEKSKLSQAKLQLELGLTQPHLVFDFLIYYKQMYLYSILEIVHISDDPGLVWT